MDYVFLFFNVILYFAATFFFYRKAVSFFNFEISFWQYSVYLFLYIIIFGITVLPAFSEEKFPFFLITYLLMIVFDCVCGFLCKIFNIRIYKKDGVIKDRITRCIEVLAKDPMNWGTLSELASCYFKLEEYDKAIEIQSKVLEITDSREEKAKLDNYIKYIEKVSEKKIKCWFCGKSVNQQEENCPKCGKKIKYVSFLMDKYEILIKYGFGKFLFCVFACFGVLYLIVSFEFLSDRIYLFYWLLAFVISIIYIKKILKNNE